jgi:redox-sensing transcriptional repressor
VYLDFRNVNRYRFLDMPGANQSAGLREAGSACLRRLPLYYRLGQQLLGRGVSHVSSSVIGKDLALDPTQVRKDLETIGLAGRPKIGFGVADLLRGIETFLGWDRPKDAVLAGAGSLGSALLRYERFREYGISIAAAFDTDPSKIGTPIGGKEVFLLDSLPGRVRRMGVDLGIITTPPQAAQRVADLMVEGGIRAIWNFAPVHVRVPEHVVLQNEDLGHSLASLSLKLARRAATIGGESHEPFPGALAFFEGLAMEEGAELSEAAAVSADGLNEK